MFYSFKIGSALVVAALLTTSCGVQGQNLREGRALQSGSTIEEDERGKYVKDSYIVVLKRDGGDVALKAQGLVRAFGGELEFVYDTVLPGFAAVLPSPAVQGLSKNRNVVSIDKNYLVSANFIDSTPKSWGLDRVDQCVLPRDSKLNTGLLGTTIDEINGGNAYIIDTGIYGAHQEFNGRVDSSCSINYMGPGDSTSWNDGHGHGTHVAATMCGKSYGVARNCRKICAVRVLDNNGQGTMSGAIAGVDYVAGNAPPGSVANLSLGGVKFDPLNTAVNNAVAAGVVMVVAAGNDAKNACDYSPASAIDAITVGAIDTNDWRAFFSNYGSCIDLFAPGLNIPSAWIGSPTATNTLSGTSMASPHVAGLAMLFREQNRTMSPGEIRNRMVSRSSKNVVQFASSSNAHLAVVPTVNCGPCNENGTCEKSETSAALWCVFDNCTCKPAGGICKNSGECCSNNCVSSGRAKICA